MEVLKIPAKEFRRFGDPTADSSHEDKPMKYRFYAHVNDIPKELLNWMDTNPRDQSLKSSVAKTIKASLRDDKNPRFHLWNRGILISAAWVHFDNRKGIANIALEDEKIHGNIDGGHTLRIILKECKKMKGDKDGEEDVESSETDDEQEEGDKNSIPNQYVEVEVITGLETPEILAEARNTSVAVDRKSIEELHDSFKHLKEILRDCEIDGNRYLDQVEFKQNQKRAKGKKNVIDVRELISIINMFNQELYPISELNSTHPIQSFSGKEVGLRRFLRAGIDNASDDEDQEERDRERRIKRNKLLCDMAPIIPDVFRLWDHIERYFALTSPQVKRWYADRTYSNSKSKNIRPAMFSGAELSFTVPKGLLYPLVGAFRALVRLDEEGVYGWVVDPIEAWGEMKVILAKYVMSTSEELAHNPANVGRSPNLWSNAFMNVYVYSQKHEKQQVK